MLWQTPFHLIYSAEWKSAMQCFKAIAIYALTHDKYLHMICYCSPVSPEHAQYTVFLRDVVLDLCSCEFSLVLLCRMFLSRSSTWSSCSIVHQLLERKNSVQLQCYVLFNYWEAGREKIWLHVSSPWAKSPAVRPNLTQSISIFFCVFEFFWLSGPRRSVLFSSRAVLVFPALSLDAYGLHTGLFFIWFSNEIAHGAERLIWLKKN